MERLAQVTEVFDEDSENSYERSKYLQYKGWYTAVLIDNDCPDNDDAPEHTVRRTRRNGY